MHDASSQRRSAPLPALVLAALLAAASALPAGAAEATGPAMPDWLAAAAAAAEADLVARYGEAVRPRLARGLAQVAAAWRPSDGDAAAFGAFARESFAGDEAVRDAMFTRLEAAFEQIDGLFLDLSRELRMHVDLDRGPILPFDQILAGYDPSAHLAEDFYANRLAFVIALNFPRRSLAEKVAHGAEWSRREWAEVRLAERFAARVPAEVNLAVAEASSRADAYIAEYNIWMHHVLSESGERLFEPGLRLISHWNLRDELKSAYGEEGALPRQRAIQRVMERIVTQTIPAAVVDDPRVDWNPFTNEVAASPVVEDEAEGYPPLATPPAAAPEPATRYAVLLDVFRAVRRADPHHPEHPTLIARRFDVDRELPEERVREMLEGLLASPLFPRVAELVASRLGRPLEPFDIWYAGFRPTGGRPEAELDRLVAERYPTAEAFAADIPRLLRQLGFPAETADQVAAQVEVHPSRGAGHAFGAGRRGDPAYLRTRVEKGGMNYKGYNIAVHELGHNVEQVLSLDAIDHTLLQGVPNTAFTEALAFVFQKRDMALLGLPAEDPEREALGVLATYWNAAEIAGVSLVDMAVWHWLYEHPEATAEQLRDATVAISREVWNRHFAPVFGERDVVLLGVYSHMISRQLYLPDYPLGHLIAFQIDQQMQQAGAVGPEFARMAVLGRLSPDLWMVQATGRPVGAEALLTATEQALAALAP